MFSHFSGRSSLSLNPWVSQNHRMFGQSFPANFRRSFFRLNEPNRSFPSVIADRFFEPARPAHHTVLQFTDLHYYNNGSKADSEGIKLIGTLAERVKPDLVVLTGDIIDARYCGNYSCFRNVVAPLIEQRIPWTYVPGNHDDETKTYTRKDLLKVLKYPFCASKNAQSFNHKLHVGPLQIYLIDSHGYIDNTAELVTYDFIKQDQIEWYYNAPISGECGIAFFHIPLVEFKQKSKILAGNKGEEPCTPTHNSGFFQAIRNKKDVHALFAGHDHWNDFTSVKNGIWLCYGRVSGFTHSTVYGDQNSQANKARGGRVIRYDSGKKLLSTWIESMKGMEAETLVSKQISRNEEETLLD